MIYGHFLYLSGSYVPGAGVSTFVPTVGSNFHYFKYIYIYTGIIFGPVPNTNVLVSFIGPGLYKGPGENLPGST